MHYAEILSINVFDTWESIDVKINSDAYFNTVRFLKIVI